METSRRLLFIDIVVDRFIFKNNKITVSPCSTFTPKTDVRLPKTGAASLSCDATIKPVYTLNFKDCIFYLSCGRCLIRADRTDQILIKRGLGPEELEHCSEIVF